MSDKEDMKEAVKASEMEFIVGHVGPMPAIDPKKIVDTHLKFESAMRRHGISLTRPLKMVDKICWLDAEEPREWLNILLLFRYPSGDTQYYRLCKCFHMFSVPQQMNISSFLAYEGYMKELAPMQIPTFAKRRACLIGADNSRRTEDELRLVRLHPEPFLTGFLYKRHQVKQYDPAIIASATHFFEPALNVSTNDCLVHAINYALRCPWFVAREQVVALMARTEKKGAGMART